jgi:hypothetical protein
MQVSDPPSRDDLTIWRPTRRTNHIIKPQVEHRLAA